MNFSNLFQGIGGFGSSVPGISNGGGGAVPQQRFLGMSAAGGAGLSLAAMIAIYLFGRWAGLWRKII